MATPEGSQFDTRELDKKMNELLPEQMFTSYDDDYVDHTVLLENLLRGIYAYGFDKPSAIQQSGIVYPFNKGLDVIQQDQSGTGSLKQLDYSLTECQGLVIAPVGDVSTTDAITDAPKEVTR